MLPPPDTLLSLSTKHIKVQHYMVDVSSAASLDAGFRQFSSDFFGALDIVVACAGINLNVPFLSTSWEDFNAVHAVNVRGVYYTMQHGARMMVENKTRVGSIICIASIASYMAIRSQRSSAYCAAKGAVRAMVPAVAAELKEYV